jgi:hypothetical protein
MNLVLKQVRTKLGGFITPDQRDPLNDFNANAAYAKDIRAEYDETSGDVWLHGKKESVRIPSEHIACILFEHGADPAPPAPVKAK